MLETQSDLVRRMTLEKTSFGARKTGVSIRNSSPLAGQMNAFHSQPVFNRRNIPWGMLIIVLFLLPLLLPEGTIPAKLTKPDVTHMIHSAGSDAKTAVTITMNDQISSENGPTATILQY